VYCQLEVLKIYHNLFAVCSEWCETYLKYRTLGVFLKFLFIKFRAADSGPNHFRQTQKSCYSILWYAAALKSLQNSPVANEVNYLH